MASESARNYERELLQHANTMKALEKAKQKHTQKEQTMRKLQIELETAQNAARANQQSWEEQKGMLDSQIKELEQR